MGEVYLAEDTKLHRKVALKFLPKRLTNDRDARERFEREARAAAALNHPNIVTIHAIDEVEGQVYIAMEYIDGKTLAEIISDVNETHRAAMPVERIISITTQIIAGLHKAHGAGIVHRDIKPSNIMIDTDGRVKILDFGLAKLRGVSKLTRESSTLGTVQYMSPEQARGEEIDHRSDIWSLGVVLYQMLAGKPPFTGEYDQAVMYSILNDELEPIADRRGESHAELERIARKALEKDRDARYQSMTSMVSDIKNATRTRREERKHARADAGQGKRYRAVVIAAVIVVAAAIVIALMLISPWREAPRRSPLVSKQVTFTGKAYDPAISPDGNYIAYAVGSMPSEIVIRDLGSGSKVTVFSAPLLFNLHWSPDGSTLLFATFYGSSSRSGGVFTIPRLGGDARRILALPWRFLTWSNDGSRIAYIQMEESAEAAIHILQIETGETTSLPLEGDVGELRSIHWSPAGDIILFQSDYQDRQVFWTVRSDGSEQRIVMEKAQSATGAIMNPRWSHDGEAIYYIEATVRGRFLYDLMKIQYDTESRSARGEPRVVMSGLRIEAGGGIGTCFSIAAEAKRLVYPEGTVSANLWLLNLDGDGSDAGTSARKLTNTTTMKSRPKISPDGTRIVFAMGDESAKNIYTVLLPAEGDELPEPKQITYMNALNDLPAWSPDGSEIAFYSTQGNEMRVWLVNADGGTPRPLEGTKVSSSAQELVWAPGSKIIYRSTGLDNYTVLDPGSGSERPLVMDPVPGYVFSPCWSHDGSRVALFWSQLQGEEQVFRAWIVSAEDGSSTPLTDGVAWPIGWSSDDEWVYALMPGSRLGGGYDPRPIFKIPSSGGEGVLHAEMPFGVEGSEYYSISGDGKVIVAVKEERQADIWLVENFDPDVE